MKTIIHNHPYVNCTFYLLNSKLKKNIYKNNKLININLLNNFLDKKHINDDIGSHSIENKLNKI